MTRRGQFEAASSFYGSSKEEDDIRSVRPQKRKGSSRKPGGSPSPPSARAPGAYLAVLAENSPQDCFPSARALSTSWGEARNLPNENTVLSHIKEEMLKKATVDLECVFGCNRIATDIV